MSKFRALTTPPPAPPAKGGSPRLVLAHIRQLLLAGDSPLVPARGVQFFLFFAFSATLALNLAALMMKRSWTPHDFFHLVEGFQLEGELAALDGGDLGPHPDRHTQGRGGVCLRSIDMPTDCSPGLRRSFISSAIPAP